MQLYYDIHDGTGPYVLMVHGFLSSRAQWGRNLAALTLRYALPYPDRVIAQVFTNSNAALADAEWIKARRASGMQQAEEIERDGRAALERIPVHPSHAKGLPSDVHTAKPEA